MTKTSKSAPRVRRLNEAERQIAAESGGGRQYTRSPEGWEKVLARYAELRDSEGKETSVRKRITYRVGAKPAYEAARLDDYDPKEHGPRKKPWTPKNIVGTWYGYIKLLAITNPWTGAVTFQLLKFGITTDPKLRPKGLYGSAVPHDWRARDLGRVFLLGHMDRQEAERVFEDDVRQWGARCNVTFCRSYGVHSEIMALTNELGEYTRDLLSDYLETKWERKQ